MSHEKIWKGVLYHMLFNSYIFIFLFLPLVLLGWYGLNRLHQYNLAMVFLSGMSLWFYGYFNTYYLTIIIISILINYFLSYLLTLAHGRTARRIGLISGTGINLAVLFYFKYYDFFVENINSLFQTDFNLKHILLPLGISFFTFQQLSFIIDRCTGKTEHYSFIHYVAFVTFFPQLIAGPIVLYKEIIPQFEDFTKRSFQIQYFTKGLSLFILGLSKKVLLADTLALTTNFGFAQTYFLDTPSTILVTLAYTFQIYFDFSGYSDMAMGLAWMFNIQLPVNFNSPYKACSVKELWQRWHMTLSRFFITYVYIPLGGSQKGTARTILNTMIVFSLSGLWHGANWTYVAWGVMQGVLVVWDNLGIIGIKGASEKSPSRFLIPKWLGWIFTFSFFNLSLFFFRSENMAAAFQLFKNLFSFKSTGYLYKLAASMDIPEFYIVEQALKLVFPDLLSMAYIVLFLLILAISGFILTRPNALQMVESSQYNSRFCWFISLLFIWCLISFSQVSTFIYFNF